MNCLCCGSEITKDQYFAESEEDFQKRLDRQLCRAKCKRLFTPAKSERTKPSLVYTGFTYSSVELKAQEKEITPRSEKYKKFIREQPCLLLDCGCGPCDGDVQAHHSESGGMAIKGSDLSCLPLCHNHHLLMDSAGKKGRGIWTEKELDTIIIRLNEEFNWQLKYKEKRP